MAAPDQEPTSKKLRRPARLATAASAGAAASRPTVVVSEPGADDPGNSGPEGATPDNPGPHDLGDAAAGDLDEAGLTAEGERVVLSTGSTYFHNGRVSPERYASDLAPTFLGSIAASHTLLGELFKEMGAPEGATIQADCDRWRLRFGSDINQAQFSVVEQVAAPGTGGGSGPGEGSGADGWVRGIVASRDADHAQALAAFEAEATEAAEAGAPQRAAIAYRAAAAAALAAGRGDSANRLQRLAGKAYLEIAEKSETLPQGVFMAYRESARSFLEAGNLPLAHKCLSKAIAIGETLGYTESA
jgi:hypothetical protein